MHGYDDDDDYGQIDGDGGAVIGFDGGVQYQASGAGQPFLRPGMPPWHMWGTTQVFQFLPPGFAPPQTHQLAKVIYRRPETWGFCFHGRLTGGSQNTSGSAYNVVMLFNLIWGVGRSSVDSRQPGIGINPLNDWAFAKLVWEVPVGGYPGQQPNNAKYTTQVRTPLLDDTDATSYHLIDKIPSQDIQCQVTISSGGEFQTVSGEASCFLAPYNHIRPDWFQQPARPETKFPGAEIGGT